MFAGATELAQESLFDAHIPGSNASGGRSWSPVPVHLQPEPLACRYAETPRTQDRAFCPHQGTDHRGPVDCAADGTGHIPIEQVIAHNAGELFRGMKVVHVHPFRITRNADLKRDEEVADDLIEMISEELQERGFAPIVRLEVASDMPQDVRELLARELTLRSDDVYEVEGDLDLVSVGQLADLDFPELKHENVGPCYSATFVT